MDPARMAVGSGHRPGRLRAQRRCRTGSTESRRTSSRQATRARPLPLTEFEPKSMLHVDETHVPARASR